MFYKNLSDFDYFLPKELISQRARNNRDESNLMVLDKNKNKIFHKKFGDIVNYITEKDAIVFNETKVIPARIFGHRENKNGKIEVLLTKEIESGVLWSAIIKPGKKIQIGTKIIFGNNFYAKAIKIFDNGERLLKITSKDFWKDLNKYGQMPTPPYIKKKLEKEEENRYQTVFAKKLGSVAAPTAGLHFTKTILDKIKANKIFVNLSIGIDTFLPVKTNEIQQHEMHGEYFEMSLENANKLNKIKKNGGKIFAVGTTAVRVLESSIDENGFFVKKSEITKIFIYPSYKFRAIDAMITNFHLPKSTPLLMTSAIAGKEFLFDAYKEAVKKKYRFFSFGDSMLIF